MARYSAIVTCTTECEVTVEANSAEEARKMIEDGRFKTASLYDGGLPMDERFHDIDMTEESFGKDQTNNVQSRAGRRQT